MAQIIGCYEVAQATVRTILKTGGIVTPVPFPVAATTRSPSLTVTAAGGNTATIYLAFPLSATGTTHYSPATATRRENTMIKLTAGQSFTFTGVPVGTAYRDLVFGSQRSYVHSSATPAKAIISYYIQSR